MAANTFTLSMSNIDVNEISIAVTGKGSEILVGEVKIQKLNGTTFENFTTFTLSADATAAAATIIPNTAFSTNDLLIIQIDDTTDKSDKVMVDFQEAYTDHTADYSFKLPATTGSYKMQLDKVNDVDFSSVETSAFQVEDEDLKPLPANSSISSKDYLVHFANEILNVKVILNNVAGDASEGNYEVSLSADLQGE